MSHLTNKSPSKDTLGDSFMKQLNMFSKTFVPNEAVKNSYSSPAIKKMRTFTADEVEKNDENSPNKQKQNNSLNLSTDQSLSAKKKVGFNLKPPMSETKTKDTVNSSLPNRNCLGSLFPLTSSQSPKFQSLDPDKPDLPYKFYNDGSYELKEQIQISLNEFQQEDTQKIKELVSALLQEYQPMTTVSLTLKEFLEELQNTPDDELRLLIEDRTETILEGRSPIRKKNYLSDLKASLKEGVIFIAHEISNGLRDRTLEILEAEQCVLKNEIMIILSPNKDEREHKSDLLDSMRSFLEKVELYELTAIYLQYFREEIRSILNDTQKGTDPELYSEIERASRTNKIEELSEFIFKIQQILLRVDKPKRYPSELRANLEKTLNHGYFLAFRVDFKRFLLQNKREINNLHMHLDLSKLIDTLPFEQSDQLLKEVESRLQETKRLPNSDFFPKAQLLLLRCKMILYRLCLQNLLKRVPDNEFNQLNFLIIERLYEKSLEDSPEIYPEVSEILENNPRIGSQKFKQALLELSNQFQINKVRKEKENGYKPILKPKAGTSNVFLPMELIDSQQMLNESCLDVSMSPCDATELMDFKEISPKILILESTKNKSLSKEDYLNIWEASSKTRQFHDEIFLNNFSSLCFSSSKPAFPEWKMIKWLRLSEAFKGKKPTLLQNISSCFLKRSKETPNYLYNAFLAISGNEFIFRRNFEDQTINERGLYFVKVCQDGIWRYIILDDFLPVWGDKREIRTGFVELMENSGKNIDIWPLLILKALAKIYTTYQSVVTSGSFAHTLRDLTGVPITIFPLQDRQLASKTLRELHERGVLLYCGGYAERMEGNETKKKGEESKDNNKIEESKKEARDKKEKKNEENKEKPENKEPPPLDPLLVHQITSVILTKSATYLEVTNPIFDLSSIPEAYLKRSQEHLQKLKKQQNEEYLLLNTEHSLLFEYQDFVRFYPEILVCHLYPEYFYVARSITHVKNTYCIRTFTLQNRSHCFLEVSQVDKRYFRGLDYDYSPVRILVGKVEPINPGNNNKISNNINNNINNNNNSTHPTLQYISGTYKQARNVSVELNLDKGSYWVLVSFDWRKNTYDATLNYYGQEKVLLEKVSYNVNRTLLDDFGGLIAKSFGQKIRLQGDKVVLYFYASTFDCLIVEHLVNNLPNKTLFLTRDYSFLDSDKIIVLGKYSKMKSIEVKLQPLRSETIMFRVTGVETLEKLHMLLANKFLNDYKELKLK